MSHFKCISVLVLGCLFPLLVFGQWKNPADKYINAYKKYWAADCPLAEDQMKHFVYFMRERELMHDHSFLQISRFNGAQVMYSWRQLEPQKGQYDFSAIREDYEYLLSHDKKLFVQIQDATFYPKYKAVPEYLSTAEYDGGVVRQGENDGASYGWVSKRWNEKVRERFALFLEALGSEFDGLIEGINLQETAIGVDQEDDPNYTPESYAHAIKENMSALKKAFPKSITMIYANFMPGEWLPWDDKGYLKSIYVHGENIGVGLGGPDLMVERRAQLNHALKLMHEGSYSVPLGIAIQDGNYVGKTGADKDYSDQPVSERRNKVPLLHAFAKDFLRVKYMFWVSQEPYFNEDVIPCFTSE